MIPFQPVIPIEKTIRSCVEIRYENAISTGFFVSNKSLCGIVTARHGIQNLKSGDNVLLGFDSKWAPLKCDAVFHCKAGADLSMILFDKELQESFRKVSFDDAERSPAFAPGFEVGFFGFPLGLKHMFPTSVTGTTANFDHRIHRPFFKKGTIGGFIEESYGLDVYIDAINNRGFSGGPVVTNSSRNFGEQSHSLVGMIYRFKQDSPLYVRRGTKEKNKVIDDCFVMPNSGYSVAISIISINNLIKDVT